MYVGRKRVRVRRYLHPGSHRLWHVLRFQPSDNSKVRVTTDSTCACTQVLNCWLLTGRMNALKRVGRSPTPAWSRSCSWKRADPLQGGQRKQGRRLSEPSEVFKSFWTSTQTWTAPAPSLTMITASKFILANQHPFLCSPETR